MAEPARLHAPTVAEQNQEALDQLLEVGQRVRLIARTLWCAEDMDIVNKHDLGTISIMLTEQMDNLFVTLAALEMRLSEVENV
jgi:hypothetical protein